MKTGTLTGVVWFSRKTNCMIGKIFLTIATQKGQNVAADQIGTSTGDRVRIITGTVDSRLCIKAPIDAAAVVIQNAEEKK